MPERIVPSGEPNPYSLVRRDDAAKREFWSSLALRACDGIGMRRMAALLAHFGSAYTAARNPGSWPDAGLPAALAGEFAKERWRQRSFLEWTAAKISGCGIALWSDAAYSPLLKTIPDPPPFLYFWGDLSLLRNPAVGVVGTRSCSGVGLETTVAIARGLAEAGLTIVSGMAKGIDRAAHIAGLEGIGGSIGVLGAGIDTVYPPENRDLYALMREKGLLVSELPPGFGVDGKWFPVRNRIISGLSRAVVVVEAAMRSGSLNTARHALEQNRELMAVPGAATAATSKGCQELVRRGAKPVFESMDILSELVPFLAESVARDVSERDLARFRKRVPDRKDEKPDDGAAARATRPPLLPWRAGREKAVSSGAPPQTDAPHPAPAAQNGAAVGLAGLEARIYDLARENPIHIDDICRSLGQNVHAVSSAATLLEVRGLLTRMPGMVYAVRPR